MNWRANAGNGETPRETDKIVIDMYGDIGSAFADDSRAIGDEGSAGSVSISGQIHDPLNFHISSSGSGRHPFCVTQEWRTTIYKDFVGDLRALQVIIIRRSHISVIF